MMTTYLGERFTYLGDRRGAAVFRALKQPNRYLVTEAINGTNAADAVETMTGERFESTLGGFETGVFEVTTRGAS